MSFRGGFRGRGGRGGHRTGGDNRRGNRGYQRGGGGYVGDRRRHQDDEDEVYHSSGDERPSYQATKAARPSNKKENLALDDNNYPTL